jgi:hypothetical protein
MGLAVTTEGLVGSALCCMERLEEKDIISPGLRILSRAFVLALSNTQVHSYIKSTSNNLTESLRYGILHFIDIKEHQLKGGSDIQNIDFVAKAFNSSIFLDMLNFCGYDQPWSLGKQMFDMLKILLRLCHDQPDFFKWNCTFYP